MRIIRIDIDEDAREDRNDWSAEIRTTKEFGYSWASTSAFRRRTDLKKFLRLVLGETPRDDVEVRQRFGRRGPYSPVDLWGVGLHDG